MGIELDHAVGRLDDHPVHTGPDTVVSPFVFAIDQRPRLRLDPREVVAGLFVPVSRLIDPSFQTTYRYRRSGYDVKCPAIALDDDHVLWGLTYRTVAVFLGVFGHGLPLESGER